MTDTIGQSAGKIWQFLNDNGTTSVSKISTETGLNKNDVQRALGWLAREEKVSIELKNGRTESISLTE